MKRKQHRQAPPTGERLDRVFSVERRNIDEEAREVELAFSSEYVVDRYWGNEVLEHSAKAMRLDRLRDGGPVLVEHNPKDHVGVIAEASIDGDRKARAKVRFGRSARAAEVFQDVVDGIKTKISVGYMVHKWEVDEKTDTWRATDWEPYEISFVSIPADPTVGVGRSADPKSDATQPEIRTMEDENDVKPAGPTVDVQAIENQVRARELKRIGDLEAMGKAYAQFGGDELARQCVSEGKSVGDLQALILERVKAKPVPDAKIGLSENEKRRFSIVRAIHAVANPRDERAQKAAAFEFECSAEAARITGRSPKGILLPEDVLSRDLSVGTTTAGGHTVATNLLAGSFIDLLRNKLAVAQVGATYLPGLVGNIAIPRQTGGATAYWVAEANAPTESQQAFDQVAMSPKTLGAFTDFSRKLLLQSSIAVEAFVQSDLAKVIGLAIDLAAINGSGSSNQPTGVLNTSGIGDVAGGTNGLAPTWAHIVDLESKVAVANADVGTLAYLTNAKVRGKLKTTSKVSGQNGFIWDAGNEPLNGYKAAVSNQVPSNLTKGTSSGVCSAITFGNWSDLVIGLWGGLDVTVDPYTASTTGSIRVVALQDVDIAVRHAESFAAMKDALTT